jgi:hypothetical protein
MLRLAFSSRPYHCPSSGQPRTSSTPLPPCLLPLLLLNRTPTPRPTPRLPPARPRPPTNSSPRPIPTTTTTLPLPRRRRPHKRIVHRDRLVQQLRAIGPSNRRFSFRLRRELNERVSLHSPPISPILPIPTTPISPPQHPKQHKHTLTYPVLRSRFKCRFLISP